LGRCLESVRGLVDEIVVVDTGSTDRTVEIAERHGAKVVHFPWSDDFAAARNESLRHATRSWILVLDADETLDPESHAEIRRLIQLDAPLCYLVRRFDYQDEEGTASIYEQTLTRLFPNHPELRYRGRIHEHF